jgi:transposase
MDTAAVAIWATILKLPEFRVVHLRQDGPDDPLRITLVPLREVGCCPHCGHASESVHRRHRSDPIRDLPIGDRAVELVLSMPQYECRPCGRFFTPTYQGFAPGTHATERFLAHVARLIQFSDIANVAAPHGIPERTPARWYYDHLDQRQRRMAEEPHKPIRSIGIDELSLKKSIDGSSP